MAFTLSNPLAVISAPQPKHPWLRPELVVPWWETIVVLCFMIGRPAYVSARDALRGSSGHFIHYVRSNIWLLHNMFAEGLLLAIVLGYLHWRGWKPADFKIHLSWWNSLRGVFLWFATKVGYEIYIFVLLIFILIFQDFTRTHPLLGSRGPHVAINVPPASWFVQIPAQIVNAYWEELTCIGYAFNQIAAKSGPLLALLVVVALRMSCHTYQGLIPMLGKGVIFLITGLYYWRTRSLWPLIFAHILLNTIPTNLLKLIEDAL